MRGGDRPRAPPCDPGFKLEVAVGQDFRFGLRLEERPVWPSIRPRTTLRIKQIRRCPRTHLKARNGAPAFMMRSRVSLRDSGASAADWLRSDWVRPSSRSSPKRSGRLTRTGIRGDHGNAARVLRSWHNLRDRAGEMRVPSRSGYRRFLPFSYDRRPLVRTGHRDTTARSVEACAIRSVLVFRFTQ
jgi:hypothetical protein